MKKWLWIGGWGIQLRFWEKEIQKNFSAREHVLINSLPLHYCVEVLDAMAAGSSEEYEVVIGWSLGSLQLHKWLWETGSLPTNQVQFCSLNPIFDFCSQPGGWPPRVLNRMQRQINISPAKTLTEFFQRMFSKGAGDGRFPQSLVDLSLHEFTPAQLNEGLDFLRTQRVDVTGFMEKWPRHKFFIFPEDPISPFPPELDNIYHPVSSHLPFLTDSPALQRGLDLC